MVEEAVLLFGQAAQPLFLVLDLAPDHGHELVSGIQRFANRLHLPVTELSVVGPPEALEDPPDRAIPVPQPAGIQHELGLDARRQRPGHPTVRKRHRRPVRERQFATGRPEPAPDEIDDVVHASGCLGERVLVQESDLAPDLADPFPAVEHQRATLDLDEQHAPLAVEQHEVTLAFLDRAVSTACEPVEAVEDLDAARQLLDQHAGHRPLAGILDLFGTECGEKPGHGSLLRDLRFQTSIA